MAKTTLYAEYDGTVYTRTTARPYTHASVVAASDGRVAVWGWHASEKAARGYRFTAGQREAGCRVVAVVPVTDTDPRTVQTPAPTPAAKPAPNVVAQNGGKVHLGQGELLEDLPFPLCRTGARMQMNTRYRETDVEEVTCTVCQGILRRRAERLAREAAQAPEPAEPLPAARKPHRYGDPCGQCGKPAYDYNTALCADCRRAAEENMSDRLTAFLLPGAARVLADVRAAARPAPLPADHPFACPTCGALACRDLNKVKGGWSAEAQTYVCDGCGAPVVRYLSAQHPQDPRGLRRAYGPWQVAA